MNTINDIINGVFSSVKMFSAKDAADILVMSFVIYWALALVRTTNAMRIVRGLVVLFIILGLSQLLQLTMLNFVLSSLVQVGLIAVIVLFQPELRKVMERFGSSADIKKFVGREAQSAWEGAILQTTEACRDLAWARVGALIVFERGQNLDETAKSGTVVNADVAAELLKNIFYPKAPLHDGAVIIQNARVAAAGCMISHLTNNPNLSRDLGMRHRAGIGMSEEGDSVVVIVSEETGSISVAIHGMLKRHLTPETLERMLRAELLPAEEERGSFLSRVTAFLRGGSGNED